jgi:hypothetical protein
MSETTTISRDEEAKNRETRFATNYVTQKQPAPSFEEALLMSLIKKDNNTAAETEREPLLERAFAEHEDLRAHCDRIFKVHRGTVRTMMAELQRRAAGTDIETNDMYNSCLRFIDKFGVNLDEETEPSQEVEVFPEEELQFSQAWDSVTFRTIMVPTESGAVIPEVTMELDYSLETWRDRTKDGVTDADDFESVLLLHDATRFLKMYYSTITNGIQDNPGTVFSFLDAAQRKKIQDYLHHLKKLPGTYELIESALHKPLTIKREELSDVETGNEELGINELQGKARIDYFHGWAADRRVGLFLARRYKNFAFVGSDCMGIHGNRTDKFSNLADADNKFSLWNYAEQIKYRMEMGDMNGIVWGWSMGGEAVRLALVLMMRDIETQLGEPLTKQKYASMFTIAETPAGAGTCDFLTVTPDGTIKDKAFSVYSGTLIHTGHALAQLGMAEWPIVSNVAGGLTEVHGQTLFPTDNAGQRVMLGIHVENLNNQTDNRVIREESRAIINHAGLSEDDMRLLALSEYIFPRIQAIGTKDLLTDATVQQRIFATEAQYSREQDVRTPLGIIYNEGHPLAASPGLRELPIDELAYISPLHYEKMHELIIIQKKLRSKMDLTVDEQRFYDEVLGAATVSQLVESKADKERQPLTAAIHKRIMTNLEMISGFVTIYGKEPQERQALYKTFSYLEEQNLIVAETDRSTDQNYTALAA